MARTWHSDSYRVSAAVLSPNAIDDGRDRRTRRRPADECRRRRRPDLRRRRRQGHPRQRACGWGATAPASSRASPRPRCCCAISGWRNPDATSRCCRWWRSPSSVVDIGLNVSASRELALREPRWSPGADGEHPRPAPVGHADRAALIVSFAVLAGYPASMVDRHRAGRRGLYVVALANALLLPLTVRAAQRRAGVGGLPQAGRHAGRAWRCWWRSAPSLTAVLRRPDRRRPRR